jgi:hypothetical protein
MTTTEGFQRIHGGRVLARSRYPTQRGLRRLLAALGALLSHQRTKR